MSNSDDKSSRATDFVRKILTVGVGTIFLTEESIRSLVQDFKLPKELLAGILDSAAKTKQDFMENFSKEIVTRIQSSIDTKKLVNEVLAENEFEFTVKLKVKKR